MKEIVLIMDHPTTEKRLERLLSLIHLLKGENRKIILSSHILIPEYIVDKCDYFLYDRENLYDTIDYTEDTPSQALYCGETIFISPEFSIPFNDKDYRYSCISHFLLSLNYLRDKGFDIIHYIEGDILIDTDEISDNFKIISSGEFDSVIYCSGDFMCGGFLSFSTKKLDLSNFLPLDKNKIKNRISESFLLESFTKNYILENHNHCVKNFNTYPFLCGLSTKDDGERARHSFFYLEGKWCFLIWNPSDKDIKVDMVSNIPSLNSSFELYSSITRIIEIEEIKDGVFNLFLDDKLYKKYNLTKDMSQFKYNKVEKI